MNNHVKHFDSNKVGRDFVVGDLHGCRTALDILLKHIDFDYEKDRLFSVGDLVDRGDESWECMELLCMPWFYPVMGNHEQLTIATLMSFLIESGSHSMIGLHRVFNCEHLVTEKDIGMYLSTHIRHGGMWLINSLVDANVELYKRVDLAVTMLRQLTRLPLVITVGEGDDRFNIVHAEMYASDDHFSDELLDNGQFSPHDIERMMWGRWLFFDRGTRFTHRPDIVEAECNIQKDLSITFSGHTILPTPMRALNQINIDTGAYQSKEKNDWFNGALTIINTATKEYYSLDTTSNHISTGEVK